MIGDKPLPKHTLTKEEMDQILERDKPGWKVARHSRVISNEEGEPIMTEQEAVVETRKLFGEDSFTECDDAGGIDRYYVGALPRTPGPYTGFMGFDCLSCLR